MAKFCFEVGGLLLHIRPQSPFEKRLSDDLSRILCTHTFAKPDKALPYLRCVVGKPMYGCLYCCRNCFNASCVLSQARVAGDDSR